MGILCGAGPLKGPLAPSLTSVHCNSNSCSREITNYSNSRYQVPPHSQNWILNPWLMKIYYMLTFLMMSWKATVSFTQYQNTVHTEGTQCFERWMSILRTHPWFKPSLRVIISCAIFPFCLFVCFSCAIFLNADLMIWSGLAMPEKTDSGAGFLPFKLRVLTELWRN